MSRAPGLSFHVVVETPVTELAGKGVRGHRVRAPDVRRQHRFEPNHRGSILPSSSSTDHPLERRRLVVEARGELVHVNLRRALGKAVLLEPNPLLPNAPPHAHRRAHRDAAARVLVVLRNVELELDDDVARRAPPRARWTSVRRVLHVAQELTDRCERRPAATGLRSREASASAKRRPEASSARHGARRRSKSHARPSVASGTTNARPASPAKVTTELRAKRAAAASSSARSSDRSTCGSPALARRRLARR